MDIFGLGWKFLQNRDKVSRVSELIGPIISAASAAPTLAASARETYTLAKPIIEEFNKVSDELVPLALELLSIFAPPSEQSAVPKPGAPVTVEQVAAKIGYSVEWIQATLIKDLGKKALPRFGPDGTYGNETRDGVILFQEKHPECGTADGWVGPATAAVMEKINPPWEKSK